MNLLNTPEYANLNNLTRDKKMSLKGCFYTYRLTYTDPMTQEKSYYMGWRTGSEKDPQEDNYLSSSDTVKKLIKEKGIQTFTKKILGVYSTKEEAIHQEIQYHARLKVDVNPLFLNQARQLSKGFVFDNTGQIQTKDANQKRSKKLRGVKKLTPEGREAIAQYQRSRIRTEKELQDLRERAIACTHQEVTCPHCGKVSKSFLTMQRWHFENCPQAPNLSKEAFQSRQALRDRFRNLNKNHPKNQNKEPPEP
jgi:hypothetical protein